MGVIRIVNEAETVKLSEFFNSDEFKCRGKGCCTISILDSRLLAFLDMLRRLNGKAIKINSGYRCPDHNSYIKGKERSYHMSGQAADIALPDSNLGKQAANMLYFCKSLFPFFYMGEGFIHVDIRTLSENDLTM